MKASNPQFGYIGRPRPSARFFEGIRNAFALTAILVGGIVVIVRWLP